MKICIVGGGNIAHALAAIFGNKNHDVRILSKNLQSDEITGFCENKTIIGKIDKISHIPDEIVSDAELIIFAVPSFARVELLKQLKDKIAKNTIIGSLPGVAGFDFEVETILHRSDLTVFSAQRVPCIARIIEKGKTVKINLKESMSIATNKNEAHLKILLENLLDIRIDLLDNFLEVNLSNSNPILHSARLYELLQNYHNGTYFKEPILFYESWTINSSEILLKMDNEFMRIVNLLGLKNIKSLKKHYNVNNSEEMTNKIKSIEAFKGIYTPMKKTSYGYIPDFNSRYFTEDIENGLKFIIDYSSKLNEKMEFTEMVFQTLIKKIGIAE